jgi:hypothetical protein
VTASLVRDTYDETAVDIVCIERVPMRLTGLDRIEAVRRLSAKGLQPFEIARLVCTNNNHVSKIQIDNSIEPAPSDFSWRTGVLPDKERLRNNARQRAARARLRDARRAERE